MSEKKKGTASQILLAIVLVLFIISFAVVFTLNCRPLYYFDIDYLNIVETSGYSESEIRENYNVLIDYNLLTGPQTLEFPTLAMSDTGRIHFEEVKAIFVAIQILCIITLILSIIGILAIRKKRDFRYLKYTGILGIVIPVVLGALIALNWDEVFVIFHHIFFRNNYWLFSSDTDPVITILPDEFFMHCAILIICIVIIGSILCLCIYHFLNRRKTKNEK